MARSRSHSTGDRKSSRYTLYAIPLIVIALFAVVFFVLESPPHASNAAVDFTFQFVIQESNNNGTSIAAIVPSHSIGEAGGYWASTQYNSYGVDSGHYPIYMDAPCAIVTASGCLASGGCRAANNTIVPPCTVHVKSTKALNYTLGDFFNVWGYSLGANNTLNIPSKNNFIWQLCIGPNPQFARYSTLWGAQPLSTNESITIFYVNPSNQNTPGCAAS